MSIQKSHYEELLAAYSQPTEVIALLKSHRAYLEMLPSMRRSEESVITIPLPIVKLRHSSPSASGHMTITTVESVMLPCEVAIVLCDPEWKIKTGREIFVFIHQPEEDFSDFLGRWRRTQVLLDKDYEWVMPPRYQHILSEGAAKIYPLFVVFEETLERIKKGLRGASLPFVTQALTLAEEETEEIASEAANMED